jgi:putative MATE family efflux protein
VAGAADKGDLTQGPVAKTLFRFALPSLAVNLIQVMNGTIASIFVGKMLGEASLAATSNANQIMFVVFAVVFGFSMAATIIVGQAAGRKDIAEVRRTTGASIGFFFIGGVVVSVLGWLFAPEVLRLLGTPQEVFDPALLFIRAIMFGLPISVINMLLPSLLRGVGDAVSPLRATLINVAVIAIAAPLMIKGFGIEGAAWAGILSNLASAAYQITHIYRADLPIRLRGEELNLLKPDWAHARPVMMLGFPLGLSMVVMGVSQMGMIGLVNREGMETVAAFGAANQIWGFLQMPAFAVATAVSAMAAQNIGAGKWDRIDRIAGAGIAINFLMTGVLVLVISLFQKELLGLFLPAGSHAIILGAHICLFLNWTHILMGVSTIVTSIVRSNGAVMVPLFILFVTAVVLRFSIGFLGYPSWGAEAIWAAFIAHAVVSTIWSLAYYRWGQWRTKSADTPVAVVPDSGIA